MSSDPNESLTNTLFTALSQCQDQLCLIRDQTSRIERLQAENERLKKELEDFRNEKRNEEPTLSPETQNLFQRNVEAQLEISNLKRKLKTYKGKANRRLSAPLSSPAPTPDTPQASFPRAPPTGRKIVELSDGWDEVVSSSPPRKRFRIETGDEREALSEISSNGTRLRTSSPAVSKRASVEKKVAAIPLLAEDGEDYVQEAPDNRCEKATLNPDNSVYRRLDELLAAPTPSRSPLARPRSSSPAKDVSGPSAPGPKFPTISNIKHTTSKPQISPAPEKDGQQKPRLVAQKRARGPEDKEPLRARPLSRLSLEHFKPNPRWLTSQGVSKDDFIQGHKTDRIKALAEALPHIPGQAASDPPPTEDELLREFLGTGSEARIASLTRAARQNLLFEAKTKRVAQMYGKGDGGVTRGDSPPGFWNTDMPNTQEEERSWAAAQARDREEVQRRYEDAIGGEGRWVFADV